MPLSCNCKRKNASLRCHHTSFCGTNASKSIKYLVFVIRNACFAQLQNCLVTMAFNFIITVPAPIRLFWVQYRFSPLSKILAWPLFTLEKVWVYTQPAINLGSNSNNQCVSELCPNGFPYYPDATDLYSPSRRCKTIFGSCFRTFCWVY